LSFKDKEAPKNTLLKQQVGKAKLRLDRGG